MGRGSVRWRTLLENTVNRGGPRLYQKPAVLLDFSITCDTDSPLRQALMPMWIRSSRSTMRIGGSESTQRALAHPAGKHRKPRRPASVPETGGAAGRQSASPPCSAARRVASSTFSITCDTDSPLRQALMPMWIKTAAARVCTRNRRCCWTAKCITVKCWRACSTAIKPVVAALQRRPARGQFDILHHLRHRLAAAPGADANVDPRRPASVPETGGAAGRQSASP
jgi:hypothetical protein